MINIKWIGFISDSYKFEYDIKPKEAKMIDEEKIMTKGFFVGFIGVVAGFIILMFKRYFCCNGIMPILRKYILVGCILGMFLMIVHEFLHLICYPRKSVGYIGINGFTPFSFCASPINKRRFIISSLLPTMLGVVPLILFCIFPQEWIITNTILWCVGTIGLATPGPDYVETYIIWREVPKNAIIQSGENGFYWYTMEELK